MSKFINLLKTLDKGDQKRFKSFLESPLFNKDAWLVDRMNTLRKGTPGPKTQTDYDAESRLLELLEEFIAVELTRRDKMDIRLRVLQHIRENHQKALFEKTYRNTLRHRNKMEEGDADAHLNDFRLYGEMDDHLMMQSVRGEQGMLQEKANALDAFYLTAKLKDACEMINRQNVLQTAYDLVLVQEIVDHVSQYPDIYMDVPSVTIYHTIYLGLTEEDPAYYRRLVKLLEEHGPVFSSDELRGLYQYAQNFCIKQINKGKLDFHEELFHLYRYMLDHRVIYDGRYISQWDYRNISTVALRLQEYTWTRKFLENARLDLHPDDRRNAYTLNKAILDYAEEHYGDALRGLQRVDFNDVYYDLAARSTIMKIYYEQEDTESLFTHINAFKVYLKRNKKLSSYQYKAHWNLVRFVLRMTRLRLSKPKKLTPAYQKKVKELAEHIDAAEAVSNTGWIREMLQRTILG